MTQAPGEEVLRAIEHFGISSADINLLSPLGARKGRRLAYRVTGDCGTTLKVRCFESETVADDIMSLRARLPHAFAPVIERCGPVLIEQWINGRELQDQDMAFAFSQAGAILGRLHSDFSFLGEQAADVQSWLGAATKDIALLENAGVISADQAAGLRKSLEVSAPPVCPTSLIHYDFCGENMLIDDKGGLRIIDNEQLTIAPAGLDLAWTCFRWPGAEQSKLFRESYAAQVTEVPPAMEFWHIVALLTGARVYRECAPERLDQTVHQLLSRIDGDIAPVSFSP